MNKSIFLILSVLFVAELNFAQTVKQWRGPDRTGVYNETHLLNSWPAEGPMFFWKYEGVGNGYGSPTVTDDKVYITGEIDSIAWLFAFDLKGKLLWNSEFGREWTKTFRGSRSAPTVSGKYIYVSSGIGNLACFDETGKKLWAVDMLKNLHGTIPYHGDAEAPLVNGDKVFLIPGGKDTNVAAFNRFTGKLLWVCKGRGESPGYNSPLLVRLKERDLILAFTAYSLLGIDAKTGELLWFDEQINTPLAERKPGNGDTHSNTAWYENESIFYIAGDGNGAVRLKLSDDGKAIKQIWRNKDIDNFMGGFIIDKGTIYSCTSGRKDLRCINASTGIVTDSLKIGTGSVIKADNHLYYYSQKGEMSLIDISQPKPRVISSFKITAGTKEHFSHPVIDKGMLYLRHGNVLMVYNIKGN